MNSAKRAVCFSPKKHPLLNEACESHSPVKISRMTVSNSNDYMIGDRTQISLTKANFKHDEKLQKDAVVSLNDLHSLASGQLLNTKCYIAKVNEASTHKLRTGEDIKKQEIIMSDATSSVKLVLYDEYVGSLVQGKSTF